MAQTKNQPQTMDSAVLKRPLLITIFSCLHLATGTIFLVSLFVTIYYSIFDKTAVTSFIQNYDMVGYTPGILILVLSLLTIIAFVSGIGMLKGSKIGWHFGAFYYGFNMFRNINALFFIQRPFTIFPIEALTSFINAPELYYVKYGVRLAIFLMFYIAMNTKRFREYFGLKLENNLIVLLVEFVIFIILASIISTYFVHA